MSQAKQKLEALLSKLKVSGLQGDAEQRGASTEDALFIGAGIPLNEGTTLASTESAASWQHLYEGLQAGMRQQQQHWERSRAAAEQQRSRMEAELRAKSEQLERLQARQAEQAADSQQQQLRAIMLETKLNVLLECYQHLETSCSQGGYSGHWDLAAAAAAKENMPLLTAATGTSSSASCVLASQWPANEPMALLQAPDSNTPGATCASGPHLALAKRCADLECRLVQQRQATTALEAEAAKLKEEVCDLQRLLAEQQRQPLAGNALPVPAAGARGAAQRTQAGGASTDASVLRRLEVAGEQLLQAQVLGAELRQQLAAKDAALQAAEARNARLQQDIKLMLGARDAIRALQATLTQPTA